METSFVTSPNRIAAKLFGSWIKTEDAGTILFINLEEEEEEVGNCQPKLEGWRWHKSRSQLI